MRSLILSFFLAFSLFACEEIPPVITPLEPGGPNVNVKRRVLIEEFTGVRCVNCPAGTVEVLNLRELYKDQVISVGVHAGSFAPPYPDSKYDFRTPEGDGIINLLGKPLGYPSAVVNRKLYDGEFDLQLGRSQWAGYIAQELASAPIVDLKLSKTYNATTRVLKVTIDTELLQTLPQDDVRLSVMLTEDQIVDVQLTPDGKKSDYSHRHNLRDMLTAFDGDLIGGELKSSKKSSRSYTFTLPANWVDSQCSIIAFAHLGGGKLDVLQVIEGKIL